MPSIAPKKKEASFADQISSYLGWMQSSFSFAAHGITAIDEDGMEDEETGQPQITELASFLGKIKHLRGSLSTDDLSKLSRLPQRVSEERKKISSAFRDKRERIKTKIEVLQKQPKFIRTLDKINFLFGVSNVAACAFIFGYAPWIWPIWYAIQIVPFLLWRSITYHRLKWHYFLFDFCYYGNVLLLANLFIFPHISWLFYVNFAFANGPLLLAVLAWKNSLVFHSIDKTTSLMIHTYPVMVVYSLRWLASPQQRSAYAICVEPECAPTYFDLSIFPLGFYILWQVAYWFKVEFLDAKKVSEGGYVTSRNWLFKDTRSILYKFSNMFGPKYATFMFMVSQLLYTFISFIPLKLLWSNFYIHTIVLIGILLTCAWNGANYYFEVFSRKYMAALEAQAQKVASEEKLYSENSSGSTTASPLVKHADHHRDQSDSPRQPEASQSTK